MASMDSFATNPWIAWWGHCLSKVSPDVKFSSNTVIADVYPIFTRNIKKENTIPYKVNQSMSGLSPTCSMLVPSEAVGLGKVSQHILSISRMAVAGVP